MATNAPSGRERQGLTISREAVPNLKQRIRVGADGEKVTSAVRMTPQWTTGMRERADIREGVAKNAPA
jgi:hypothetical protein